MKICLMLKYVKTKNLMNSLEYSLQYLKMEKNVLKLYVYQ